MVACGVEEGICLLEFYDRRMLKTEFKQLTAAFNVPVEEGDNPHFGQLRKELDEYFSGERKTFSVPLVPVGSPFQSLAWKALMNIPYGSTRSYQQQAVILGQPDSVRAVANANGMNKIAIIIPCHRVIGADGKLTGYGGGLWRKRWLLDLEQRHLRLELTTNN